MSRHCPGCDTPVKENDTYCRHCGTVLSPAHTPKTEGVPWDHRKSKGFAAAAFENMSALIKKPGIFYSNFHKPEAFRSSLFYILIFAISGALFSGIWSLIMGGSEVQLYLKMLFESNGIMLNAEQLESAYKISLGLSIIASPIISILRALLLSAAIYAVLSMFGTGNRNYKEIFAITAYAETASIAQILPGLGGIISLFVFFGLVITGLRVRYRIGGGQATLAVLALPLPLLLLLL